MSYGECSQELRIWPARNRAENARLLLAALALLRLVPLRLFAKLVRGPRQLGFLFVRDDVFTLPFASGDFVLSWIHVVVFAHVRRSFQGRCQQLVY